MMEPLLINLYKQQLTDNITRLAYTRLKRCCERNSFEDSIIIKCVVNMMNLLLKRGELDFIYTAEYFMPEEDKVFFDDSYTFIDQPVHAKKDELHFPFDKLKGRKVIYISLDAIFGNYKPELYQSFFDAFADSDAIVVLAANKVDLSLLKIPENFIVRDHVPQSAILQHTDVAITHCSLNNMSDLIYYHIPFVAIPLNAEQVEISKKAAASGATIALNANTVTPAALRNAVDTVLNDPSYLKNINRIRQCFTEAGSYKKTVEELFWLQKEKHIA